jgi:3-hydroxyisobutyrate dehydrogenase-like beta-hydroxyacid dehydrogenase
VGFSHVGIIGFGEVGRIFARDLMQAGVAHVTAYDVKAVAPEPGVVMVSSAVEAVTGADLVISSVTAGGALAALAAALPGLGHGPFVLDVNSVSPGTKQATAAAVEAAGGRYVEAAVMTSVPPKGLASPMWLGGPHAEAFVAAAEGLGMNLKVFSAEIGGASSVKMCRSIMIKGLEALTTECMLTARHYGVEEHVLASLGDTLPHPDWRGLARYVMSRALIHGKRRSEEVMEVAVTVDEAGVPPMMSRAIAERQALAAEQGRMLPKEVLASGSLDELLDTLLAQRALSHRTAAD